MDYYHDDSNNIPPNKSFRDILCIKSPKTNHNGLDNEKITRKDIFKELINKQLQVVPYQLKLSINDMNRICKYINCSIFNTTECCIWNGYITNSNNKTKGTYINFYFRNKKVALHRLLYSNFIYPLTSDEYIKYKCENKGICCNVNHLEKYKYIKHTKIKKKKESIPIEKNNNTNIIMINDNLIIDFD